MHVENISSCSFFFFYFLFFFRIKCIKRSQQFNIIQLNRIEIFDEKKKKKEIATWENRN